MTRKLPKLARLELQILEVLWARGQASVREIQEGFPEPRPAYTARAACDEHVIAKTAAPIVYAEGIVTICRRYVEAPHIAVAVSAARTSRGASTRFSPTGSACA